jgi:hypothetical protein
MDRKVFFIFFKGLDGPMSGFKPTYLFIFSYRVGTFIAGLNGVSIVKVVLILRCLSFALRGRDSSVVTVTRYGLDGPGVESRWGRGFPYPSRPALGPTQPPIQ